MKESKLITLDKTYLKEKFVEYNQLYFNNALPKVPIFSIINTPHLAGQYCARWGVLIIENIGTLGKALLKYN